MASSESTVPRFPDVTPWLHAQPALAAARPALASAQRSCFPQLRGVELVFPPLYITAGACEQRQVCVCSALGSQHPGEASLCSGFLGNGDRSGHNEGCEQGRPSPCSVVGRCSSSTEIHAAHVLPSDLWDGDTWMWSLLPPGWFWGGNGGLRLQPPALPRGSLTAPATARRALRQVRKNRKINACLL